MKVVADPDSAVGSLALIPDTSATRSLLSVALVEWAGPVNAYIRYVTYSGASWFQVPIWVFGERPDLPFTAGGKPIDWWTKMDETRRPFTVTAADLVVQEDNGTTP